MLRIYFQEKYWTKLESFSIYPLFLQFYHTSVKQWFTEVWQVFMKSCTCTQSHRSTRLLILFTFFELTVVSIQVIGSSCSHPPLVVRFFINVVLLIFCISWIPWCPWPLFLSLPYQWQLILKWILKVHHLISKHNIDSAYLFHIFIQVKYLGEEGENTPVAGAASICSPWDLLVSCWI